MGAWISQVLAPPFEASSVVSTKSGRIRGRRFQIPDGRKVDAFLGIPYAKPPIGELRFEKPQSIEPWMGVRECVKHGARAPQKDIFIEKILIGGEKSEDCLYLNVFAPTWTDQISESEGRPVMIWIHGGAFVMHSSLNYGDYDICKNLCSKNVIVVTLQYRLGILGFSSTNDSVLPGNLGLWDQALAIKWVKENARSFCGNPDNITIFGHSAGAASADILALSPYTRDLFTKVIAMGGSASCDWAVNDASIVRQALVDHAHLMGWRSPKDTSSESESADLIRFLRNQPSHSLEVTIYGKRKTEKHSWHGFQFTPVVDGDFIPNDIETLRQQSPKKTYIVGTTDFEALFFAAFGKRQYDRVSIERMVNAVITERLFDNFVDIRQKAQSLYLKEGQSGQQIMHSYIRLFSDLIINNGVHKCASSMLKAGHTVYLYNFVYCPRTYGLIDWYLPFRAATHCTELPYVFGRGIVSSFRGDPTDITVLNHLTLFITNFSLKSTPNGEEEVWQSLSADNVWRYLHIDENPTMKDNYQGKRAEFWNQLLDG